MKPCKFIVQRFVVSHLAKGVKEVHTLFDRPVGNCYTLKGFEQSQSDAEYSVSTDHEHYKLSNIVSVPQRWHEHSNCCHCKHQ